MTTAHLPAGLPEGAGLSAPGVADWAASAPAASGAYGPVTQAVSAFLVRGQQLACLLPGAREAINGS